MTEKTKHIVAQINFDAKDFESVINKYLQDHLSRDQAIKRIRDIQESKSCDHLCNTIGRDEYYMRWGASLELMAIFDIKEEEL